MILEYENSFFTSILKWFKQFKQANYATVDAIFELYNQSKQCPSFYYNRGDFNLTRVRQIKFQEADGDFKGIPITFKYVGTILVEDQDQAYNWMQEVMNYFDENAYIPASLNLEKGWPNVKVAQRLLYIKVDDQRTKRDLKGPMRAVEFSWMVQLMVTYTSVFRASLIKKVIIGINNQIEFKYE